jgi:hypothetical protein
MALDHCNEGESEAQCFESGASLSGTARTGFRANRNAVRVSYKEK